jgi:hypothetical protein
LFEALDTHVGVNEWMDMAMKREELIMIWYSSRIVGDA